MCEDAETKLAAHQALYAALNEVEATVIEWREKKHGITDYRNSLGLDDAKPDRLIQRAAE